MSIWGPFSSDVNLGSKKRGFRVANCNYDPRVNYRYCKENFKSSYTEKFFVVDLY